MQKKYIPFAVFFVALLVFLAHFGTRYTTVAKPAFVFADTEKQIYLTFDDGPSTKVTGAILDTLKEENVKATFFVVGDRVYGRREILRRMADEGHSIGVHSKTHIASQIYASDEALLKDISACAAVIEDVTGHVPTLYRFPYGGEKRARQKALVEAQGYTVVSWNAECGDGIAKSATAESILKTAIKTAGNKSRVVLLMHDGAGHEATVEALPRIIAHFREAGYAFRAF